MFEGLQKHAPTNSAHVEQVARTPISGSGNCVSYPPVFLLLLNYYAVPLSTSAQSLIDILNSFCILFALLPR